MTEPRFRTHQGGRARRKTPDDAVVGGLEMALVSALLLDPVRVPSVLEIVAPPDFLNPKLATVISAMAELHERGEPIELPILAEELDRQGKLEQAGGAGFLAEVVDFESTAVHILAYAQRLRRHALERQERELHRRVAEGEQDSRTRARLAEVGEALDALEVGEASTPSLTSLGFTGDALRALRDREEPVSPLPGYLDPEPHLQLLQGKPKSAKTTFALTLARAWALGEPPWTGAPALPRSRVLIVSREQSARRLDHTLRRLSTFGRGNGSAAWPWTDHVTIVGRDSGLPRAGRKLLTLDDEGLRLLRSGLLHAAQTDDPFGLVVLDSLSRLKPPGVEEIDNDAMSAWLDALEDIASEAGVYMILVHHVGHSTDPSRSEARSAGRGASAIAACAQVVWLLERVAQNPRHRLLKVDGNAILPAEFTFEVAPETAEPGAVYYFRPVDPAEGYALDDLLGPTEEITISELARRLSGEPDRPGGQALQTAKQLMAAWRKAGLVETRDGPRRAVLLRRRVVEEASL